MDSELQALLEDGRIVSVGDGYMAVEVNGVELFVDSRVIRSGCDCCGDRQTFDVSYNRPERHRVEKHGESDPLRLERYK